MGTGDRILIIKLAALGDVVQALGPFAAIRAHHRDARVVLLTTAPYQDLARATGLFDDIWLDERPRGGDLAGWMRLRAALRAGQFDRVYDLQTSDRSSFYLRLFWPGPRPRWSGIAKGCSHPHANPLRDTLHTLDRQAEQLAMAGIETVPQPGTALTGNDFQAASPEFLSNLGLRPPFALLIPGGAA
ncbi:MAG TPA: ADP-heptose--LPS heptosyltransferase, partial [Rhodospirillales bacterium]|nr:ADP-heptose--LPS heptosyltransferase [Rhodospirillales bacterium]